jgi:ParB family chromosome partitioning protein
MVMADETSRKGLGRGLSALLGEDAEDYAVLEKVRPPRDLPIEFLRPSPFQPRHRFDDESQRSLVDSVREHGVLQPLLVRRTEEDADTYEIVAGERRWRAAQAAQLTRVPVIVKEIEDREALELALVENVQREDLTPIEEAAGYQRLMDEFEHTQERLGQMIGRSRSHIANTLRLLNLPDEVKEMLQEGVLSAGQARPLLGADDPVALAQQIVEGGLNVRKVESITRAARRRRPEKDPDTVALEGNLAEALGLRVDIAHRGDKGGSLKIAYASLEQLDDVCRRLIHHVAP